MGKSMEHVREILGEPDDITEEDNTECWRYQALTYDFDKPWFIFDQKFLFDEDYNVYNEYRVEDSKQELS